jgi:hypothetical protein
MTIEMISVQTIVAVSIPCLVDALLAKTEQSLSSICHFTLYDTPSKIKIDSILPSSLGPTPSGKKLFEDGCATIHMPRLPQKAPALLKRRR